MNLPTSGVYEWLGIMRERRYNYVLGHNEFGIGELVSVRSGVFIMNSFVDGFLIKFQLEGVFLLVQEYKDAHNDTSNSLACAVINF